MPPKSLLLLLLLTVSQTAAKIVEIECENCEIWPSEQNPTLDENDTWRFLCDPECDKIRMVQIPFPRFPREIFTSNAAATELEIRVSDFEELQYGDFGQAVNLQRLTISGSSLTRLGENCFWGASNLRRLEIFGNQHEVIVPESLNGLPMLETLFIRDYNLTRVTSDYFKSLPALYHVDLYNSNVERIDSDAFLRNENLFELFFHANNITELDLVLPRVDLKEFSLSQNPIRKLTLRSLDFTSASSLVYIDLTYTEIRELYIQSSFLIGSLELYGNKHLTNIDWFPQLPNLIKLDLRWCDFGNLDEVIFAEKFKNLKTLLLDGNNIDSFTIETFAGLNQLETLRLSDNNLTEVVLGRMEALTSLNLSGNKLTEFPYYQNIKVIFPNFKEIDLRNNQFDALYKQSMLTRLSAQSVDVKV